MDKLTLEVLSISLMIGKGQSLKRDATLVTLHLSTLLTHLLTHSFSTALIRMNLLNSLLIFHNVVPLIHPRYESPSTRGCFWCLSLWAHGMAFLGAARHAADFTQQRW